MKRQRLREAWRWHVHAVTLHGSSGTFISAKGAIESPVPAKSATAKVQPPRARRVDAPNASYPAERMAMALVHE